jgi:hypothetical protein
VTELRANTYTSVELKNDLTVSLLKARLTELNLFSRIGPYKALRRRRSAVSASTGLGCPQGRPCSRRLLRGLVGAVRTSAPGLREHHDAPILRLKRG